MNKAFYKIIKNEKEIGFCFFCNIRYKREYIPVMITNNQIINEAYLANNNNVKISINNKYQLIHFGYIKYFNKKYDISIIEIVENKESKINYLELDDIIYENEDYIFDNKESLYCINYSKDKNITVTFGIMNNINNKEIKYLNYANQVNDISLIFNLSSNKIIGYNNNISYIKSYNRKGISFKFLINEFIKELKCVKNKFEVDKNHINEINIKINVDKSNISNKIYFLNNIEQDTKRKNYFIRELYINNEKQEAFNNYFIPEKDGEYNINLKFINNLTDCSFMFYKCQYITNINFVSFVTRYITNMKYMFFECSSLKDINLFSFDTKNVTDMSYMFYGCKNLINIDLSSFDNKNVKDMSHMFEFCENLNYLNLSSFIINNNINIDDIFSYCWHLTKLDFDLYKNYININEIDILIKIQKNDINNKIYFL